MLCIHSPSQLLLMLPLASTHGCWPVSPLAGTSCPTGAAWLPGHLASGASHIVFREWLPLLPPLARFCFFLWCLPCSFGLAAGLVVTAAVAAVSGGAARGVLAIHHPDAAIPTAAPPLLCCWFLCCCCCTFCSSECGPVFLLTCRGECQEDCRRPTTNSRMGLQPMQSPARANGHA